MYSGKAAKKDKLCDDVFKYKVGAKVVMLVNDNQDNLYQNGTMATITAVQPSKATITVTIDSTGKSAELERQVFSKGEYKSETVEVEETVLDKNGIPVLNLDGKPETKVVKKKMPVFHEIGTAEQFPMRLGYAVTIHKSQGQTYEAMNLALSRCKTVQKVYVGGTLTQRMVMASEEVVDYYKNPDGYSFFDTGDNITMVAVPRKYVSQIQKLIAEWESGASDTDAASAVNQKADKPAQSAPTKKDTSTPTSSFWNRFKSNAPQTPVKQESSGQMAFNLNDGIISDGEVPF